MWLISTDDSHSYGRVSDKDNKKTKRVNWQVWDIEKMTTFQNGIQVDIKDTDGWSKASYYPATTAATKIFFSTTRCTNGRKVACVRSNEIAARFVTDANGNRRNKAIITRLDGTFKLLVQKLQSLPKNQSCKIKRPPIRISAIARLITRYMLRFRRLRSFR